MPEKGDVGQLMCLEEVDDIECHCRICVGLRMRRGPMVAEVLMGAIGALHDI